MLADKFTEFYPQIYYEGEVIDFIRQKIEDLETKNCLYNRGKNLSEYFIEPLVEEISSPLQLDNQKLSLHDNVRMSFFKLKQIIYHSKRIILIGDPGSGKSGSVAKLAIEVFKQAEEMIFKNSCEDKIDIPIIIPANNILLYSSLDKLIDSYLQSNELKERFRISLLILDGLDESPVDKRSEIINKADLFANQLNCSVIITSRKIDIIEIPPKGFQKFELLHFQFSQALKLFEKIVSSPNTLNLLREGLEKIKSQIPMIPLSLMFMVELVEENKEIPASVTELYDRYYDMALGRWDAQKGISVLFEYIIKKRFISALAFDEYLNKDRLEITCDDFTNYLTEYSQKYRWDENKKKTFLNEIKRAGILDIRDVVMFKHRSILDYFAAYYIYYKRAEIPKLSDLLQKLYYSDLWSEVTFFYIGLHREITEDLIKKIFDYKDTDTFIFIKKMLVGQLLQAGWNSISDIKRLGLQKSISYAGKARCSFLSLAKTNSSNIPEIFADILLMGISEASYGSNFLIDEIKYTITQLNKETTSDNVYQLLLLLFAIRKLLNATELHKQVDNMLNLFPKLSHEEQARNLLIAMLIENEDKSIKKAIKNKLHKLIKKNPSLFEGLFPNKRKQLN